MHDGEEGDRIEHLRRRDAPRQARAPRTLKVAHQPELGLARRARVDADLVRHRQEGTQRCRVGLRLVHEIQRGDHLPLLRRPEREDKPCEPIEGALLQVRLNRGALLPLVLRAREVDSVVRRVPRVQKGLEVRQGAEGAVRRSQHDEGELAAPSGKQELPHFAELVRLGELRLVVEAEQVLLAHHEGQIVLGPEIGADARESLPRHRHGQGCGPHLPILRLVSLELLQLREELLRQVPRPERDLPNSPFLSTP